MTSAASNDSDESHKKDNLLKPRRVKSVLDKRIDSKFSFVGSKGSLHKHGSTIFTAVLIIYFANSFLTFKNLELYGAKFMLNTIMTWFEDQHLPLDPSPVKLEELVVLPNRRQKPSTELPTKLSGKESLVRLRSGPIPDDAIHFLVTVNYTLSPKPRELCMIEATAHLHPDKVVLVSLQSDLLAVNRVIKGLVKVYKNIAFLKFDIRERLQDTPLEEWYERIQVWRSKYAVAYHSDLGRVATLYKYGGYYIDTDEVALRRFTSVRNSIGLIDAVEIWPNNNFLAFDKGHPFLEDYMSYVINA
jgi:hypothetical protein